MANIKFREEDIQWSIVPHGFTGEMVIGKLPCGIDSSAIYKSVGFWQDYNYSRAKKKVIKRLKRLVNSANRIF